jgi:hypothetical protein
MADKAPRYPAWVGWAIGVVWAVLVFCATIPAGRATSNLQSWAILAGLPNLGKYLAGSGTDNIVLFLAILSIANHLKKFKGVLEEAFRIVKKALRDEMGR